MPLVNCLNVPHDANSWDTFLWNNRDQLSAIRDAIQNQTGNVVGVEITSNGAGYTSAPTVTITDVAGNGFGATAFATYTVSGGFYSIAVTIENGGHGYVNPIVTFSGGGGTGATGLVAYDPIINLTVYQVYPVNLNDPQAVQTFLENNQQAHDDFNGALGLPGVDLEGVDIKDKKQLEAWTFLNYQELYDASAALEI